MTLVRRNNSTSTSSRKVSVILRTALILVVYVAAFFILDWLTLTFQINSDGVAWYPPDGLSFALLLTFGWGFAPMLAITSLLSSLFVHNNPPSIELLIGWAIFFSTAFGVTSVFLRRRIRFDVQLRSLRDVIWLILASAIVSAILALVAVSGNTLGEAVSLIDLILEIFIWWIGEMVGILAITPFLLIHVMPLVKQFAEGTLELSGRRIIFSASPKNMIWRSVTLFLVLYLAFRVPALEPFRPQYLIAIPLIWISLEYGIKGASLGNMVVSFATMAAIWLFQVDLGQLSAIQLLMLVLSIASLLIGVIRSEQIQGGKELGESEKRFRALVEKSMEEVSLVKVDGTLLFESPSTRRPLGYPPNSFLGKNIFDLIHPDDQVAAMKLFEQVAREPGSYQVGLFRLQHQEGSWRWMEGILTNLLDEPAVQAIVINYRDVTERKQAEDEIRSRTDELSTLYELSRALAEANELDDVLDLVNRRTVESMHVTFARIALVEGDELTMRSVYPIRALGQDLFVGSQMSITNMPYCQSVLEKGELIIVRTSSKEVSVEERAALLLDFAQILCLIPLRIHDPASHSTRILGLLMVGEARNEEREPFTPEKIRLARSIGDQAAIAIYNTRLFNDLDRSNIDLSLAYDATITGWSAALDLRDKETEGHTLRVTEMTLRLAARMGLSGQELIQVRRGALLHDIGKMGVPDRILLKPDKLTDEEWFLMRRHPDYAYRMLKPITYLGSAVDIPYCHHEKWDGTGYPRQLKGENVPLTARIFAIVDVYDALTSDRPYRKGWSREKTLDHIRELSGSHFDPQVVDMFLKMTQEDQQDL